LGPKTESRLSPPTALIRVSGGPIPAEESASLQYLYSNDTNILCGSIKLDLLARLFARVYGPALSHPALRHMVIALLMSKSQIEDVDDKLPCVTVAEQQHIGFVFGHLRRKLENLSMVDESDILTAYLLAIYSEHRNRGSNVIEVHVQGVIAIMRHLARELGTGFLNSSMTPVWALLRDEILWLTRKSPNCSHICHAFREILGPKSIQQRRSYENELRTALLPQQRASPDTKIFFGRSMLTSVHTMIEAAHLVDQLLPNTNNSASLNPLIESVIVELRIEQNKLDQRNHEPPLAIEISPVYDGGYVEDWQTELAIIERLHDLYVLLVCRLATLSLDAPSIEQGLETEEARGSLQKLIHYLRLGTAFCQAGIKDGRVFGTGIGSGKFS